MDDTAAPAPTRKVPAIAPATSFYESPFFLVCCALLTIFLQIINNGYTCFRIDHVSQIPLLFMKADPALYHRDWFLHDYGHFDLRKYHLLLMTWFGKALGLAPGILALYLLAMVATLWAWYKISKKIYGSCLPGLVAGVMGTYLYGQEIASNHPFEKELIPRTEAYPLAYFGIYCALSGRTFFAGLLLALSSIFQPAVGLLFALPVLIWLAAFVPKPRWKGAGLFLAGFVLPFSYRVFSLREAIQDNELLSASEEILLAAYIRHPHHMIPHLWGFKWLFFAAFFVLFALAYFVSRRRRPPVPNPLARMAWIIAGVLALCTWFIEVQPVKLLILLQPFRMVVLWYMLALLVIAPYLIELLRRPEASAHLRALLLIFSGYSRFFFTLAVINEVCLAVWERKYRLKAELPNGEGGRPNWVPWLGLGLVVALAVLLKDVSDYIHDDMQHVYRAVPALALGLLAAAWAVRRWRVLERTAWVAGALGGAVALGFITMGAFFFIPERLLEGTEPSHMKLAERVWDYQFNPVPIRALELLGAWAERNTAKDALFIIPPDPRFEGFQIWAKRAAVFCFKYIPLKTSGLKVWKERYLELHGIDRPEAPENAARVQEAMTDYGGLAMEKAYNNLAAPQILEIARKYDADYLISERRYETEDAAHFKYLTEAYNRGQRKKSSKPMCVFQIVR